jgi:hypothetical protein
VLELAFEIVTERYKLSISSIKNPFSSEYANHLWFGLIDAFFISEDEYKLIISSVFVDV